MGSNETSLQAMISEVREKKRKLTDLKTDTAQEIENLQKREATLVAEQFGKVARELKVYHAYSVIIKGDSHLFATRDAAVDFAKEKLGEDATIMIEHEEVNDDDLLDWAKDNRLHFI
jgi:hydroxymethylpyrimidine/phosphomethylpyrimidine kinase